MYKHKLILAASLLIATVANAATVEMKVNGLVCAFCAQGIEKTLRKYPATADVLVSLEENLVVVSLKDGLDIGDAELKKALTDSGYSVTAIDRTQTPISEIRARLKSGHK